MAQKFEAENITGTIDGDIVTIVMNIGTIAHHGAKSEVMASLGSGLTATNSKGQTVRIMGNAFTVNPRKPKNAPRVY
jgi:hypothetical protein